MVSKAKSKKNYIWTCGGFTVDGADVWFVPYWENVLCRYNLITREIEDIITFPNASILIAASYNVKRSGERIIVIPAFERGVYIYDKKKKQMENIVINDEECPLEKYRHCIVHNDRVYMFPIGEKYVISIDLEGYGINKIKIPVGERGMYVDYIQIENKVYLVNLTERITVFDLENEEFSIYSAENINMGEKYRTINSIENNRLFLTSAEGNISIYNIQTQEIEKKIYSGGKHIDYSLRIDDKIYLFPHDNREPIIRWECNNWHFSEIMFSSKDHEDDYINAFSEPELVGDYIYIMDTHEECMYMLDQECNILCKYKMKMMEMNEEVAKELFSCGKKQGKIYESPSVYATLEYYCANIQQSNYENNDMKSKVGKEIYKSIARM